MRTLIAFILLLGHSVANASTITIDFSDPNLPADGLEEGFEGGFNTQGFSFSVYPTPVPPTSPYFTGGEAEHLVFCQGCDVAMEGINGETFSLVSFDAQGFPVDDLNIEVTGFLAGGGTLVEIVALTDSQQLYELNWDGLIRVEFDPNASAVFGPLPTMLDNIIVANVVPIPAAVWLFGSAIGLLGWMRRKTT
jgi:hypothetical protein